MQRTSSVGIAIEVQLRLISPCPCSDAWLAFLRLELPDDIYKRVLTRLHDIIMPALFNPLLLADFLTHSLDRGEWVLGLNKQAGIDWMHWRPS